MPPMTVNPQKDTNFPPSKSAFCNEADVETLFMGPFLIGPKPLCLGFSVEWVRSKVHIRSEMIGKRGVKRPYFPDFLVNVEGLPLVVVEVKSPGENLTIAAEEARMYAASINSRFEAGINPCRFCLVSDGLRTELYSWDNVDALHSFQLSEVSVGVSNFDNLRLHLDSSGLQQIAKQISATLSPEITIRPVSRVGGESAQSQQIAPNQFGQLLVSHYSNIFTPNTLEDRKKVATEAYIISTRAKRYMDEIERVVDRMTPMQASSRLAVIQDTGNPAEVTEQFSDFDKLKNQIMLFVGLPGAGKSTFIDHLQYSVFPGKAMDGIVWVRINFNDAPSALDELFAWTRREIVKSLRSQFAEIASYDLDTLQKVFKDDIDKDLAWLKGIYGKDSEKYSTALAERLVAWIADDSRMIDALELYLCKGRGKLLVIACDNCDKRIPEVQLRVFEVVQWLKTQVRALTMLPIRDSTYDLNKDSPPLDTAVKALVYQINPPSFQMVLTERIKLLMKEVKARPPKRLSFAIENNARIEFDADKIISFLRAINRSLFSDKRLGKRLIQGLSGKNVRKGIQIFLDLCRSGYLPTDEVFYSEVGEPRPFEESVTYNIFMRMDRRFYSGDNSLVRNLYQGVARGRPETHFTRLRVCQWLRSRLGEVGPSGLKGFH